MKNHVKYLSACLLILTVLSTNAIAELWSPEWLRPAAWYDASDASTVLTNGTSVTNWMDKSGNGRHLTQTSVTNQPETGIVTMGGRNTISFDGTNDYLNAPAGLPDAFTSFFVFRFPASTSTGGLYVEQNGTSTKNYHAVASGTFWYDNWAPSGGGMVSPTLSGDCIGVIRQTAINSRQMFYNGNTGGTDSETYSSAAPNKWYVGARVGGPPQQFFDGPIAEILFFASALSVDDRQKIEGYLAWRWGLQGKLPASHPYKGKPPYKSGTVIIVR
jgi:hypothetical protein